MAKIINSGIGITGQRGRNGSDVFARNIGGEFSRAYASPVVNPNAIGLGFRDGFANITALWQLADPWVQEQWNRAASRIRKKNSVGNTYTMSGFNYFLSQTLYIILAGGTPSLLPVQPRSIVHPKQIDVANLSPLDCRLRIKMGNGVDIVPANQILIICASDGVSPGITKLRNRINLLTFLSAGAATNNINILADMNTAYGSIVSGRKYFFATFSASVIAGNISPRLYSLGQVA